MTQYPIVLAHGLCMSDTHGPLLCWGRIPEALRQHGAKVYLGGQDAWGSIETCAAQLAEAVRAALDRELAPRVNLIAHSKGGLEARYLISTMGFSDKVASLTLLSTPNRGARPAEHMLKWPAFALWARRNDRRNSSLDAKPQTLLAYQQLSEAFLTDFNQKNPDMSGVYYQSWGARLGKSSTDRFMQMSAWLFSRDADTDGLVSPDSAQWGDYQGTLDGVSHQELVDLYRRDTPVFQPVRFYCELLRDLAAKGF